jgi:ABC-2 type transport system ATP-binding protein
VGIIDNGELIALGTLQELTRLVGEQELLRLHFGEDQPTAPLAALFEAVEGVKAATASDNQVVLSVGEAEEALPGVVLAAAKAGAHIRSVDIEEPNLEAVFLHLTGKALRD